MARRILLTIEYDGTAYSGWQRQYNGLAVQQLIEEALTRATGEAITITGASRTDAGVHARVYVANFRTSSTIPVERLPYALNTHLPCDIVVTKAFEVHENFNAIGSCARKEYTYQIYNSRLKNPFYVNRAWFYPRHLDENVMQAAASQFVGTHDFLALCAAGSSAAAHGDTVRTITDCHVTRRGDEVDIEVTADGYLYNMVRILAGTLCEVGAGRLRAADIPAILASRDRSRAGPTLPAKGLFLKRVEYPERKEEQL